MDGRSPEVEQAEMIAIAKQVSPQTLKRPQAYRQSALKAARERKRSEFQGWSAGKLAALLNAQRDNAKTFPALTRQFDGEAPKARRGALYALVFLYNWTQAYGDGASSASSPSAALALDWMKNTLGKDKDPKIRELAARGIAFTQPTDAGAITALLTLLGGADAMASAPLRFVIWRG